MGEVYLVQHPRLPRQEALKVLRPEFSRDVSFRERFVREADLASGLRHPHIVSIHDRGEHDGQLWIAMDYVSGIDLGQLLAQRYPEGMPVGHVMPIVAAVASALDYAHKKGLLHRDVKPANIIVADHDTDEPSVFLADFGIARPLDDTSGITTTNMTVGTVAYAAPEQLMGEQIDGRADQYALAATTYHALAGVQPFPHTNPAVVISGHLNSQPPELAVTHPDLVDLDQSVRCALSKSPEARYATCNAFVRALMDGLSEVDTFSASASTSPASSAKKEEPQAVPTSGLPAEGRVVRRYWTIGAALALVAVVIGGLLVALKPWDRQPAETSTSPTALAQPIATASSASSALPPTSASPPVFPPKEIDEVLLSPEEVNNILGTFATSATEGQIGLMKVDDSSYGMSDNAGLVTPQSCVGVIFTAEHAVYGGTDFEEMRDQTLSPEPYVYGATKSAPSVIQQTVTVYLSPRDAEALFDVSRRQWTECANGQVDQRIPPESGRGFTLGQVQRADDYIAVSMGSNGGYDGAHACQQTLGSRINVVVAARVCTDPASVTSPMVPGNPAWATDDAERLVNAMLDKIHQ
jgi:serine/threonine-protein kinase